jgi:hypothetical protein
MLDSIADWKVEGSVEVKIHVELDLPIKLDLKFEASITLNGLAVKVIIFES